MRIGGDDPDERSKHGVPRQQDLTEQQPPTESPPQKEHVPPQSSSQPLKQQSQGSTTTSTSRPQVKQDAPRQQPEHERQESRPKSRTYSNHHDRNIEFKFKRIHQQLMMDGESDLVLWKQVRKRWRLMQESELPPVPEDDHLNATVIDVMTEVEDDSSVIDAFAVNCCATKTCRCP